MYLRNTRNLRMAMATGIILLVAIPIRADNNHAVADMDYDETILKFYA